MRYMCLGIVLVVLAGVYSEARDDAFYERRAVKFIKAATDWVIEEGIPTYYEGGREGFKSKLYDNWHYVIGFRGTTSPHVETKDFLAWFRLTTRGVDYDIKALYRETRPDGIYEFWLVRVIRIHHSSSDTNRSMFYVTRADDVRGRRVILHKRNQFIKRYRVGAETYFEFPMDDLDVVSKMDAWRYPESYPDSDLKNLKVTKNLQTGRITMERGDGKEWAYQEEMDGNLMFLSEIIRKYKQGIRAGVTFSEEDWEETYEGLVRIISQNGRGQPIKEQDWKRYKRWFDKLERLDKTAAKDRFDAKERLSIEWEDEN